MWNDIWCRRQSAADKLYSTLAECIHRSTSSDLDPLDASDIERAIGLLNSKTALGVDFLDVGWLKRLPQEAFADIAELLYNIENSGAWPIQASLNIIVLMRKPAGGVRPIALMPILYRIWCRARRTPLVEWELSHQGHWGCSSTRQLSA